MVKNCLNCAGSFEIHDSDLSFYERVSPAFGGRTLAIPAPSLCPDCRVRRRLLFRNFFNLYARTSDLSGQRMLSMYPGGAPFPVYELREWWGDSWDGIDYGQEPRFDQSVFEQLKGLHFGVPRAGIMNSQCENTDYCNFSFNSKNCYLVFGNVGNQDCCYGHIVWQCTNCFDCLYTYRSELCYQCVDCVQCYNVCFSVNADNCSDSALLTNCVGCKKCFACVGLRNKEYYAFNQRVSEDEFEKILAEFYTGESEAIERAKCRIPELVGSVTVKHYHGFSCEGVTGDYLYNCKNTHESYDLKNCEDCRYCATVESFIDCHDCTFAPTRTELSYNCLTVVGYNLIGCHNTTNNSANCYYCDNCYSCQDCFASVGLRSKQFCIFNRQYSRDEYHKLVPRLVERMQKDGEWGEFFSPDLTPFAYNESMAQEYFPLSEEDARNRGYDWKQKDPVQYQLQNYRIPSNIREVSDQILGQTLACSGCGRNYRIAKLELDFYRRKNLPLPTQCPDCRHRARMTLRNPRTLWERQCSGCGREIKTTFEPGRAERVCCENCYLQEVY